MLLAATQEALPGVLTPLPAREERAPSLSPGIPTLRHTLSLDSRDTLTPAPAHPTGIAAF